jgi:hypothetical protein
MDLDDVAHMMSAVDAAARGDIEGAIEHESAGLVVEESLTIPRLRDLAAHDPAPAWAYSRWCVDQAMRWLLLQEDERTDAAVRLTLAATHADHVEGLLGDPTAFTEYGTLVVATDWVTSQLAVFEYGGLADFLDRRAEQPLLTRCDRVAEWVDAPMSVFSALEHVGPTLLLRDLLTGEDVSVLNTGALSERGPEALLMGRLVPISTAPGLLFESRPLEIDQDTAAAAVRQLREDPALGWLVALSDAREAGRLERGFSCHDRTLFTSDLTIIRGWDRNAELAPAQQELVRQGFSPAVANAIGVLGVALIAAEVAPDSVGAVTPHVVVALTVPGSFECALTECVEPGRAVAFERLADATYGVTADRCRELARACRDAVPHSA